MRRLAGNGSTVSLIGAVNGQGVYPIEAPDTNPCPPCWPQAGGVAIPPEVAQVTVIRGRSTAQRSGSRISSNIPEFDIALRGGDRILVEQDTTRLHRAWRNRLPKARVTFETQTLSAIEAIATVGGLTSGHRGPDRRLHHAQRTCRDRQSGAHRPR